MNQKISFSTAGIAATITGAICVPFLISLYFDSNLFQSLIAPIVYKRLYSSDSTEIPNISFSTQLIELFPLYLLSAAFALFVCWMFHRKSIGWERPFAKERKIRTLLWGCALILNIALAPIAISISMSDGIEILLRDSFSNFMDMTFYLFSIYGLHFYVFTFFSYQLIQTLILKQNNF